MRRAPVLLLVAVLPTACATDQHDATRRTGFAAAAVTDGANAPAADAAPDASLGDVARPDATGDLDALEADLRQRLATAADPAPPAIELAALLGDLERHREAAAVLAAARLRSSNATLRIAQASMHRDLGQRHLAVAELRDLCREHGAFALHPGLLFEFAELLWLEGDAESARAVLAELRSAHADHAWCRQNAGALRGLELEMSGQSAPASVRIRDLLGNLRGAPVELVRLRTLEELVGLAGSNQKAPQAGRAASWRQLRDRAIAIGCGDDAPTVRARAIQLAEPPTEQRAIFFRAALADPSALVRRHAAACAAAQLGDAARRMLLDGLAQEQDVEAFLGIHEALASVARDAPPLTLGECGDAGRRAATVQYWKRQPWAL